MSWNLQPFIKCDDNNPCLTPKVSSIFTSPINNNQIAWEEKDVFNPAACVKDNKVHLIYRAEDTVGKYAGTSRFGLAISEDGRNFETHPEPVLYPDNDDMYIYEQEGGCEDPRIAETDDGRYILTYTAFNGELARLAVAVSTDLIHWEKKGLCFAKCGLGDIWSKAGAILMKEQGDKNIATKIDGKYWMYFGESSIYVAYSDDLLNWTPVFLKDKDHTNREYGESDMFAVLSPRNYSFDSYLCEPASGAYITDDGIRLIYNGANHAADKKGDPALAERNYSGGQALFSLKDPTALIARSEKPFITPDKDYEITGQVGNVCFSEGLVKFNGEWLLYYGTADSKIAVASHKIN